MKKRIVNILEKQIPIRKNKKFASVDDDVYVISYPRSGNTWIRYLLANLLEPDLEWDINTIGKVIPDIHETWPVDWIPRSPRIIKSHHPYQRIYRKVIYIYRDGRDVAISYFHYLTILRDYQFTFDEFLDRYLAGKVPYGSWHIHVASWLFDGRPTETLPIKYENLVAAPVTEIQHIGDFLGTVWPLPIIEVAIEKSSFQQIQNDYKKLKFNTHWRKGFHAGVRGGPGKWIEVFTPKQNNHFWDIAGSVAQKLGYSKEPV